jgi:SAM-dependent methyltransferase
MNDGLLHTLRHIYSGDSLARVSMNVALSQYTLQGRVVDIGGGRDPDYFKYLQQGAAVVVEPVDGSISHIDFEVDRLPYESGAVDTVLMCNILEHIYNHNFLMGEVSRILKPGGQLVGFVPFWVGYHPDPQDYFRYTPEALKKILATAGFTHVDIVPVGRGPLLANYNNIMLSLPRFVRPALYVWYATFDNLFVALRPASKARNPFGYIFTASK